MKRVWRSVLKILGGVILGLALMELLLRCFGQQAFESQAPRIESRPQAVLCPHPELGLALRPGQFEVTINEGLVYHCRHLSDSSRYCGSGSIQANRPEIALYGCSLTYGMGVEDSLTFAYGLQKALPEWWVHNYGVPAYGTIQSYLQLKRHLAAGRRPGVVVLHYTALHDARNKLSPVQQKYWREAFGKAEARGGESWQQARFPYLPRATPGPINPQFLSLAEMPRRWSLSQFSATSQILEVLLDHIYDGFYPKQRVSKQIILAFAELCRQQQIPFLLVGMTSDEPTQILIDQIKQTNLATLDMDLDLTDPRYNLLPHDSHPNPQAHQQYAQKLLAELLARNWVDQPSVSSRFYERE